MFSDLRSRASKVADAGAAKFTSTRDRMTSQPGSRINWEADVKSKPPPPIPPTRMPPPPSRTSAASSASATSQTQAQSKPPPPPPPMRRVGSPNSGPSLPNRSTSQASHVSRVSVNSGPPPPPRSLKSVSTSPSPSPGPGPPPAIRRETRPDFVPPASSSSPPPPPPLARNVSSMPKMVETGTDIETNRIDWANLSPEDKQVFFGWLDEFFARFLNVSVPPRSTEDNAQHVSPGGHTLLSTGEPPRMHIHTRSHVIEGASDATEPLTSYPPRPQYGSAAEDLANYFTPSTHWPSAWYTSDADMLAPPVRGSGQIAFTASWESNGTTKTLYGGVLFSDLSMCFYSVSWPQHAPPSHNANDTRSVRRSARYLPPPNAWPYDRLLDAHETYGETVAGFAESFEGTGQPCARGECWDLANEALRYFEQYDYVPKPVPSISRTHGHLIYEGRASDKGRTQAGRWRGGDDRVRRGDIVEWRSARVGMGRGGWAILGDPEHTAVIVREMVPAAAGGVADGRALRPAEMGTLEVIEQSAGKPPARASYNLADLEEGEVWIYRPVGMEAYVGSLLVPKCPEGVNALNV